MRMHPRSQPSNSSPASCIIGLMSHFDKTGWGSKVGVELG